MVRSSGYNQYAAPLYFPADLREITLDKKKLQVIRVSPLELVIRS